MQEFFVSRNCWAEYSQTRADNLQSWPASFPASCPKPGARHYRSVYSRCLCSSERVGSTSLASTRSHSDPACIPSLQDDTESRASTTNTEYGVLSLTLSWSYRRRHKKDELNAWAMADIITYIQLVPACHGWENTGTSVTERLLSQHVPHCHFNSIIISLPPRRLSVPHSLPISPSCLSTLPSDSLNPMSSLPISLYPFALPLVFSPSCILSLLYSLAIYPLFPCGLSPPSPLCQSPPDEKLERKSNAKCQRLYSI